MLAVTLVAAAALLASGLPHWTRLALALPVAATAVNFLQGYRHFCVGFARVGLWNFGAIGQLQHVTDPEAHAADLRAVRGIVRDGVLIGVALGVLAVALP